MNLKEIRIKKGITQEELAKRLGINQNNISRYETNERTPNLYLAKEIASALDCTVDELLADPVEMSDDEGRI